MLPSKQNALQRFKTFEERRHLAAPNCSDEEIRKDMEAEQRYEALRDKGLSHRAASVVVNAAMYGIGCVPEKYRDQAAADFPLDHLPEGSH